MLKVKLLPYNKTKPIIDNRDQKSLEGKYDYFKFEQLGYFKLLENGTYYYPAWKHYNRKVNVVCDRCNRQNLRASIGYSQFDLCLSCVDELTRNKYDCPSRYCHETKIIRDNLTSNAKPEYIDLNKFYQDQYVENNKEGYVDKVKKIENFEEEQNTNNYFDLLLCPKNIAIIVIILCVLYLIYNQQ